MAGLVPAIAGILLSAARLSPAAAAGPVEAQLSAAAYEARRTVVIIDSFYQDHHACPLPSIEAEIRELEGALGDGFAVEPRGRFATISALMMPSGPWRYYSSPRHPDRCTLWRDIDGGTLLIWRRHRYGAAWSYDPGDGKPERSFKPTR
jgi:hypothetical protein